MAESSPIGPPPDPIAVLRLALRAHYDIEREIGQGAFATVYLARDLKHERKVAIKVLHADPTSETGELRFIREIRLLARLQHPNILPLHDSGHVETLLYYVMPYVSGETLRDRIDHEGQLAVDVACNIARDVADALAYAHGQGIIHRDIKPENILLSAGHPILADFGIARVIDLAGVRQLTRTGMGSPGTPAYMSPEQLLGDRELDGRSDTYSLACVLFEMLTGKPPFMGKDGFVKRFTEPPPRVSSIRRDLPQWLGDALARALERDPARRYPTAREFSFAVCPPTLAGASLPLASDHVPAAIPAKQERPRMAVLSPPLFESSGTRGSSYDGRDEGATTRRAPHPATIMKWLRSSSGAFTLVALGLAIAASIVQFGGLAWRSGARAVSNSEKVVILPMRGDPKRGELLARRLRDRWSKWDGLYVVSDLEVTDALAGKAAPRSLAEARQIARELGAGKLVWGEVSGSGDADLTRLELYDVGSETPSPPRPYTIDNQNKLEAELANSALFLLRDPARPSAADGGDGGTSSYNAWRAYGAGHVSLSKWALSDAMRHFADAVANDPRYAAAHLWLAQVSAWMPPESGADWKESARKAAAGATVLSRRDSLLAKSLTAMADEQYPVACAHYRALTGSDPNDFVAWYGLAECQSRDKAVLPDRRSVSRWRFRSSFHSAVVSYQRAFRLAPQMHSLLSSDRLERILPTAPTAPRWGQDAAGRVFMAYPSLSADTIAFIPYPDAVFATALPQDAMSTLSAALERDTQIRYEMAREWVKLSPSSADAQEALASILETRADLTSSSKNSVSAVSALHRAQELATTEEQKARLAASQVRLQLKLGNFAAAQSLGDSVLRQYDGSSRPVARELAPVAALVGRIDRMADLVRAGSFQTASVDIPPQLRETGAKLFARAALGVCDAELANLQKTLKQSVESYAAPEHRTEFLSALEQRALSFTSTCTSGASALQIPAASEVALYSMQQAFARRDFNAVRSRLKAQAVARRGMRPGDISMDYTYHEAWLRAAIGDTTEAIKQLDRSLTALPTLSATALKEPAAAAAVGRAIMLRTDLAAATGDARAARTWASALVDLWRGADLPLQLSVRRMKQVASNTRS